MGASREGTIMSSAASSRAEKVASFFRQQVSIKTRIAAPATRVWQLLTDAADFPRWNSTVASVDGTIALGNQLRLKVPQVDRTFTPRVVEFQPHQRMVWRDGFAPMFRGERTFDLEATSDGSTDFTMVEVFSGLMLPLIRGSLPDFAPRFERYAFDLKTEAERAPAQA
jgi:hypothetical protein